MTTETTSHAATMWPFHVKITRTNGHAFEDDISEQEVRGRDHSMTSPTDPGDRTGPGRLFAEVAPSDGEAELAQLAQEIPAQFAAWAAKQGLLAGITEDQCRDLALAFMAGWAHADAWRAALTARNVEIRWYE